MSFNELQKKVSLLVANASASPADYFNLQRAAPADTDWPDYVRKPKLAFLSNFTIQGLPEILKVRGVFHNLWPEVYLGPYDQVGQEILDEKSGLYAFQPDLIYLFIDSKTLPANEIKNLIDQLLLRSRSKIVVFDPIIERYYQNNTQVHLFDFKQWRKDFDHEKNWYTKYKDLGDLRLAPQAFPDLAESLLSIAVAMSGATKKCIVADLDNTLWEGILGEDGSTKIKPRKKLQEFLLKRLNQGIILAINSRNNEDEVLKIIETHPDMLLRKKDFADWQINWSDKAQNMAALAESLNLGIDSFVFLDDDEFQLDLVREAFPQVATISAKDEQAALNFLKNYAGFSKFKITDEDLKRGQMYAEERQRKTLQVSLKTVDEFLKELNLKVNIEEINDGTMARAAQLTQKTNQFNLTTRRYSQEQIKDFVARQWKVWTVNATDKFGDYGIIGLIMIEPKDMDWDVHNFLMSCRILGRGIEDRAIKFILEQAKENKIKTIFASYKPTGKNSQASDFWDKQGFSFKGHSIDGARGGEAKVIEKRYHFFIA